MYWFHGVQLLLFCAACSLVVGRAHELLFRARCDGALFRSALGAALERSQVDLAQTISRRCKPAWAPRLANATLDALRRGEPPAEVRRELDELRVILEQRSAHGLGALRALGRIAAPLAFLGIILELGRAFGGDHGLLALKRGAAEALALERSLLSFCIGLGTASLCLSATVLLGRRARELREELAAVSRSLEHAIAARSSTAEVSA